MKEENGLSQREINHRVYHRFQLFSYNHQLNHR
jgi:hypothetical protein